MSTYKTLSRNKGMTKTVETVLCECFKQDNSIIISAVNSEDEVFIINTIRVLGKIENGFFYNNKIVNERRNEKK